MCNHCHEKHLVLLQQDPKRNSSALMMWENKKIIAAAVHSRADSEEPVCTICECSYSGSPNVPEPGTTFVKVACLKYHNKYSSWVPLKPPPRTARGEIDIDLLTSCELLREQHNKKNGRSYSHSLSSKTMQHLCACAHHPAVLAQWFNLACLDRIAVTEAETAQSVTEAKLSKDASPWSPSGVRSVSPPLIISAASAAFEPEDDDAERDLETAEKEYEDNDSSSDENTNAQQNVNLPPQFARSRTADERVGGRGRKDRSNKHIGAQLAESPATPEKPSSPLIRKEKDCDATGQTLLRAYSYVKRGKSRAVSMDDVVCQQRELFKPCESSVATSDETGQTPLRAAYVKPGDSPLSMGSGPIDLGFTMGGSGPIDLSFLEFDDDDDEEEEEQQQECFAECDSDISTLLLQAVQDDVAFQPW